MPSIEEVATPQIIVTEPTEPHKTVMSEEKYQPLPTDKTPQASAPRPIVELSCHERVSKAIEWLCLVMNTLTDRQFMTCASASDIDYLIEQLYSALSHCQKTIADTQAITRLQSELQVKQHISHKNQASLVAEEAALSSQMRQQGCSPCSITSNSLTPRAKSACSTLSSEGSPLFAYKHAQENSPQSHVLVGGANLLTLDFDEDEDLVDCDCDDALAELDKAIRECGATFSP